MNLSSRYMPFAAALLTVMVWAAAFPAIGVAVRAMSPLPLAAFRFATAAPLLLLAFYAKRSHWPGRASLLPLCVSALLCVVGYNVLLNAGQSSVPAGTASFIVKLESVVATVGAVVLLREPYPRLAWLGTGVCLAGVGLLAATELGGPVAAQGVWLVVAAAACSGVGFLLQRPVAQKHGALACTTVTVCAAALLLSPWLPTALAQWAAAPRDAQMAALFLGIFPTALGLFSWMFALSAMGAARAANFLYLVPPLAMVLDWVGYGHAPTGLVLAGGAVLTTGVLIVGRASVRSTR